MINENRIIAAVLWTVKALTVIETARSTLHVFAGDWIAMILIDGVFTLFWIMAGYNGQRQRYKDLRPFASAAVWIMYAALVVIAMLEGATSEIPTLALVLLRLAAALALFETTADLIMAKIREFRSQQAKTSEAERLRQARSKAWRGAYKLALVWLRPIVWYKAAALVYADLMADAETAQRRRPSEPAPAVIVEVPAKAAKASPALIEASAKAADPTMESHWSKIEASAKAAGGRLSTADIKAATGLGVSQNSEAVNYCIERGYLIRVQRGQYELA